MAKDGETVNNRNNNLSCIEIGKHEMKSDNIRNLIKSQHCDKKSFTDKTRLVEYTGDVG